MATHPDSPRALLIAGMHRSGTSAAALALARLGWSLGADQLETQASINRDGFGENRGVVALNEKLLAHFGSAWYELFDWPDGWENSVEGLAFVEEARALIAEQFAGERRILLKDPRLCLTLPLWLRALQDGGFDTRVILQWRHPQAVADSLARRDSLPVSAGLVLWMHYTLAAEHASRGIERAWLRYEDLLRQGAEALSLFDDLDIPGDLDAGIDSGLSHHAGTEFTSADAISAACERVMAGIGAAELPSIQLSGELGEAHAALFNEFARALTMRAAEAVRVGEEHARALSVIAEKDEALEQSAAYARQCEAVISEKDRAIEEVTTYARQCEATVASKDAEIAEVSRYASECESVIAERDAEIAAWRKHIIYRLLRKLRVLK